MGQKKPVVKTEITLVARETPDKQKPPQKRQPPHGANTTNAPTEDKITKKKEINLPGG